MIVLQLCEMPPLLARNGLPRVVLAVTSARVANEAYSMWSPGTLVALSSLGALACLHPGENETPDSFWPIALESAHFGVFITDFPVCLTGFGSPSSLGSWTSPWVGPVGGRLAVGPYTVGRESPV